jgi:hypothetical protein
MDGRRVVKRVTQNRVVLECFRINICSAYRLGIPVSERPFCIPGALIPPLQIAKGKMKSEKLSCQRSVVSFQHWRGGARTCEGACATEGVPGFLLKAGMTCKKGARPCAPCIFNK